MLFFNYTFILGIFVHYVCILSMFILFFQKQNSIFSKIWCVLFFFLIQCLLLGFFGEDFFTILIVVSELPIFFCFFFFYISKTQLKNLKTNNIFNNTSKILITLTTIYFIWMFSIYMPGITFTYFQPDLLLYTQQRSDFFIYYFSFFVAAPQIIVWIGLLITAVTLILLLFTFKNQLQALSNITKTKQVAWTRVQDTSTQNTQKKVFTFFKI